MVDNTFYSNLGEENTVFFPSLEVNISRVDGGEEHNTTAHHCKSTTKIGQTAIFLHAEDREITDASISTPQRPPTFLHYGVVVYLDGYHK